jgi:Transmembrane domain of unknown function (DUF3566)
MTQSPFGGTASPNFSPSSTQQTSSSGSSGSSPNSSPSTDFGPPTISGAPTMATDTLAPVPPAHQPSAPGGAASRPAAPPQAPRSARGRGPRRARLQLRHISPLTVLKFSCVLAIALFFVWLIIVGVLYGVLDAAGAIEHVNNAYTQLNGPGTKAPITAGIVFGGAAIVGVVNIILFVALTTIGSVIYNLCADLVGGVEITLSER